MSATNILIIDITGDCCQAAAKTLEIEGHRVVMAADMQKASELMSTCRPSLIVADCSLDSNPLTWLDMAHHLGLTSQVIAVADQPDFNMAMDWIAGGIYNVLARPLDIDRFRKMSLAAIESCNDFNNFTNALENKNISRALKDFYHGLTVNLDSADLTRYITNAVKKLTGASQAKLCLAEDNENPSPDQKHHKRINDLEKAVYADFHNSGSAPSAFADKRCLTFKLVNGSHHLGEFYLHFSNENDLQINNRETISEMVMACAAALAAANRYKKASALAARDGLTGLFNRRIFDEFLEREFSKATRHNLNLSLLSLDLDHFKSVNDNFGHQAGDMVIKAVARIIADVARNTDLPSRLGGEEFAIILPHTTQEQALILARRIKNILAESIFKLGDTSLRQTVSQGVAGLELFMVKSPEDMVYWADQALYLAKREGRDTIRMATELPMTKAMKDGPYAFQ